MSSQTPEPPRERSPKRRRLSNGYASSRSASPTSRDHYGATTHRDSPDDLPTPTHSRIAHLQTEDSAAASPASTNSPLPSSPPPLDTQPRLAYRPQLILRGHKRAVSQVKISPNGAWIASASADATVRIWNADTGAHQQTLRGHLAGISALAWNPSSTTLATGSDDKTIRLWDMTTGKAFPTPLLGHHNYVFSLAFSPKGNMLVSGSYDEAVYIWDVRTARVLKSLPAHSDPVGGVDFVRDGTLIVSCSSDGLLRVWDTATGQCLKTIFHEDHPPMSMVRFTPNGRYVAAWSLDSCVRIWDYYEGRCAKTYKGHVNKKFSLSGAFGSYTVAEADDDEDEPVLAAFLASGSETGEIVLWDVVTKEVMQRLKGHDGAVFCVDVHPTQRKLVSCGEDKTIRVWVEEVQPRETHAEADEQAEEVEKMDMEPEVKQEQAQGDASETGEQGQDREHDQDQDHAMEDA